MKATLVSGLEHTFSFSVTDSKTVPAFFPEATEFAVMPKVLATGYMVALFEWTCVQLLEPHLDWPAEQSVGTHVDVSHVAATPPGLKVTVHARLVEVDRRRLVFEIEAHDDAGLIGKGRHERFVIDKKTFDAKLNEKIARYSH